MNLHSSAEADTSAQWVKLLLPMAIGLFSAAVLVGIAVAAPSDSLPRHQERADSGGDAGPLPCVERITRILG